MARDATNIHRIVSSVKMLMLADDDDDDDESSLLDDWDEEKEGEEEEGGVVVAAVVVVVVVVVNCAGRAVPVTSGRCVCTVVSTSNGFGSGGVDESIFASLVWPGDGSLDDSI